DLLYDRYGNPTNIQTPDHLPLKVRIGQNYPNPCRFSSCIPYYLKQKSRIMLRVFEASGRIVFQKQITKQAPGEHVIKMDFENLAPGIYLYQMQIHNLLSWDVYQKTYKIQIVR
ncbi:MAG: hypothetical protein DRI73_02945, partial [Bacteroidetes bacterium]